MAMHLWYLLAEDYDGDLAPDPDLLAQCAREQAMAGMAGLALGSEPRASLDDLILAPEVLEQIREILTAAGSRGRILGQWRLGERITRGTGICCLFDGKPGTGKTLAADVIAAELGLRLMRVNIPAIVDKYIGETEKNLSRIFAEARPDLSVLLFDEADSLFSKRTEVKHSTDRYSNMDINVLLQLIEGYEGLTILTTNLKSGIDTAFERRISFKVEFELPDDEERETIWRRLLPEYIPVAEPIDYAHLSRIELSGGGIKNAILRAAYAAAHAGELLSSRHLATAAAREAAAGGRVVHESLS